MTRSNGMRWRSLVLVVLATAFGLMGSAVSPSPGPTGPPQFQFGDSSQFLRLENISFAEPAATDVATVDKSSAKAIASAAAPGISAPPRDVFLAKVTRAADGCFCWVVDLTPPGGLHIVGGPAGYKDLGPAPASQSYFVVFVDASTGKIWSMANWG